MAFYVQGMSTREHQSLAAVSSRRGIQAIEPLSETIRHALGDDKMERLAEQAATMSFTDDIRIAETN